MGYRLYIKKDNMHLVSISRYDELYKVCESEVKMDDEWHKMTEADLLNAKENAFQYIDHLNREIDCYEKALIGELDFDKRVNIVHEIGEMDDALEKYHNVLPQLNLLLKIVEESDTPIMWGVF